MDPHSPNKLIATKYCFLILGDDTSFFFFILFIYFSFLSDFLKHKQANINFKKSFLIKPLRDFMLFYVILLLLIFTKIILLLLFCLLSFFSFFFHENYCYFFMFRDSSGMFRVPGFIDPRRKVSSATPEQINTT